MNLRQPELDLLKDTHRRVEARNLRRTCSPYFPRWLQKLKAARSAAWNEPSLIEPKRDGCLRQSSEIMQTKSIPLCSGYRAAAFLLLMKWRSTCAHHSTFSSCANSVCLDSKNWLLGRSP